VSSGPTVPRRRRKRKPLEITLDERARERLGELAPSLSAAVAGLISAWDDAPALRARADEIEKTTCHVD
jgi:hypothetical protein